MKETTEKDIAPYLKELTLNLQHEGFTVGMEADGLLPVELDGQRLCLVTETGGVRYRKEDAADEARSEALDKVVKIADVTAEYMGLMEQASQIRASGLEGDYRALAEFNSVVLAGHRTRFGVEFVTWEWVRNYTALWQGHYYGDGYTAAKQDFAVRSGLIRDGALFAPEQLTEVYRSIHETLDDEYPITAERQKLLESVAGQIERTVPDLAERVELSNQKELEVAEMEPPDAGGMTLC